MRVTGKNWLDFVGDPDHVTLRYVRFTVPAALTEVCAVLNAVVMYIRLCWQL